MKHILFTLRTDWVFSYIVLAFPGPTREAIASNIRRIFHCDDDVLRVVHATCIVTVL